MMCYLVAIHNGRIGSIALCTSHGKHLTALKKRIEMQVGLHKIQLVTISRPSAYSEYEPYRFVDTEAAFEEAVSKMR